MISVKIDDTALKNALDKLDDSDEIKELIFKGIKKGAKTLQDKTKGVYKSYMPTANNKMIKGVKVKNDKAYTESTVHIMGDYRNKWFEMGTKERIKKSKEIKHYWGGRAIYKKNGSSTGKIKAIHFFEDAQRIYEDDINKVIDKTINDELNKIWNT